jgi:hypothetical protein
MSPNAPREPPYSHQETRQFLRPWHINARKPNGGDSLTAAAWRLSGALRAP